MRSLGKLTWVELKLFVRDPFTVLFTFAYPFFVLFILAGVFGNTLETPQDVDTWRGVGPTDYYVPAYVGVVLASIGFLALPLRLAGYRERGVLRRFRASSLSVWWILGSQMLVAAVMAVIGAVSVTVAARIVYGTFWPRDLVLTVLAFLLGVVAFGSIGVFLGAVLPNSRAAQSAGLILFFATFMISGAGPPPEALGANLEAVSRVLPLTHVVRVIQDPWLGYGWSPESSLIVAGMAVASAALSVRLFRWE
ncbi:MAG TPA: ABC transporter permease [Dehalococcoidia bacterium]|nr:ABC transporter permease [Dehalococcoidia bacterium]